jgi:hypothetical protein
MAMTPEEMMTQLDMEEPAAPDVPSDIVPREMTIEVNYRMGDGTILAGEFVHAVMTAHDEINFHRLVAAQRGGMPPSAFSADALNLIEAAVYVTVTMKDRPDWAKNLTASVPPDLVFRLWQEGLKHRARFLDACRDLRSGAPAL